MDTDSETHHHGPGEYLGVLVVDAEGFSAHDDVRQKRLAGLVPRVLEKAAARSGTEALWNGRRFPAHRGDGYLFGFDPGLLARVVDFYLDALQSELRSWGRSLRAEGMSLRLRASVHAGPLQDFDSLLADSPAGKVMIDTHRAVDAPQVRALLEESDPGVTFLGTVVSEEVMERVVRAGHSVRRPSEFVVAPLEVAGKDYRGTGYLRVPVPSGDLLVHGLLRGQPEEHEEPVDTSAAPQHGTTTNTGGDVDGGNVVQGGHVGSFGDHGNRATHGSVAVGSATGPGTTVGHTVDQSSGKQEFSGNFGMGGDGNFGPSAGRRVGTARDDESGGQR
ncbi:hypothetical protein FHX42_000340 [Saccharopolyspora lacisalsi]|uniref:Guanylate cyclase domain-containing protein n=1 Tax=Halosaccharopolyspora lacisalsi TaxID=1000566 RepID=A0A839DV24_9PSEU|nr:hypothetical protein [Halosaccharopolyspora lacisalsi]MBA8823011.1 hypothetical protein [Halosaccharopolyspora lacisalsi]